MPPPACAFQTNRTTAYFARRVQHWVRLRRIPFRTREVRTMTRIFGASTGAAPALRGGAAMSRRGFLRGAVAAGSTLIALGAVHAVADDDATRKARASKRADGRPRLPPRQYLIERLRPMGGEQGEASPGRFQLAVSGEVEQPYAIDFAELLHMP